VTTVTVPPPSLDGGHHGLVTKASASKEAPRCDICGSMNIFPDEKPGQVRCHDCGCITPGEPISVGDGQISVANYVRRLQLQYQELEHQERILQAEYDQRHQPIRDKKDQIIRILSDLRDARCAWLGCQEPPLPRSHWCEEHKPEHEREMARDRQRRHRERERCHASGSASRLLEH
jgi:hypothetical protein